MDTTDEHSERLMREESKVRLPNVDEVLNLGYSIHVSDDPALVGKKSQDIAKRRVDLFLEIETEKGSPERAYYECVSAIANSLGRGITRRKENYMKALERALTERNERRIAYKESQKGSNGFNLGWRMLKPVALGLSGILTAQFVGLFTSIGSLVHTTAVEQSSTALGSAVLTLVINIAASILMGVVFIIVGRSISLYMIGYRNRQIERDYRNECYIAELNYEEAKLLEFGIYRRQLCSAWQQYAGEEYPETISYQNVTEGDIIARHKMEQRAQLSDLSDIRAVARIVRRFRGRKRPSQA